MIFLRFLGFCLFSYGLITLANIIFKVPNPFWIRRINKIFTRRNSDTDTFTEQFEKWGNSLARYIKLNEINRKKLLKKFELINISTSPEEYIGTILAKCSFLVVIGIMFSIFLGIFAFLILLLVGFVFYRTEMKKIDDKVLEKRRNIDKEMFSFASSIEQELKIDRNIIRIFSNYRKISGEDFKRELDLAIVDMQSGSMETALLRMEKRNGSANLSEIIRGILGVISGDNNINYFQALSIKFRELDLNLKRETANKLPTKLGVPQTILFLSVAIFILIAFAMGMSSSMSAIV